MAFCIAGMRVWPPTSTISLISAILKGEASIARFEILIARSSEFLRELFELRARHLDEEVLRSCIGRGDERNVYLRPKRGRKFYFAFPQPHRDAGAPRRRSLTSSAGPFLKVSAIHSIIFWSISCRRGAHRRRWHALDHIIPHLEDGNVERAAAEIENHYLLVLLLLKPYASAAAVGSLMMRFTSRPAILRRLSWPAAASLKYATFVMTASGMVSPSRASASPASLLQYHRRDLFRPVPLVAHLDPPALRWRIFASQKRRQSGLLRPQPHQRSVR